MLKYFPSILQTPSDEQVHVLIFQMRKVMGKEAKILSKIIRLTDNIAGTASQDSWTLSQF